MTNTTFASQIPHFIIKYCSIPCLGLLLISPISVSAGTVMNTNDSGPGSLRQAISNAVPYETINFTNTLSGETILLTSGQILIDKSLTIDASAIGGITIDGNGTVTDDRVLEFPSGTTSLLSSITITGGISPPPPADIEHGGGGIMNGGMLTLTNCSILNNSTSYGFGENGDGGHGGGIMNTGILMVINCSILNNSTEDGTDEFGNGGSGGGIYSSGGTLTIKSSVVSGNITGDGSLTYGAGHGGGIYSSEGTITVENSLVSSNTTGNGLFGSGGSGGGICSSSSSYLTMSNTTVSANITGNADYNDGIGGHGGGIYTRDALFYNCYITNNLTGAGFGYNGQSGHGGGIYSYGGTIVLEDSTVSHNNTGNGSYGGKGGGIFKQYGMLSLTNSTVSSNVTSRSGVGGGIYSFADAVFLYNSTISDNRTGDGDYDGENGGNGGGIYKSIGELLLRNSIVSGNRAGDSYANFSKAGNGGGIYFSGWGQISLLNTTISGNTTGFGFGESSTHGRGGGIITISSSASIIINNSTISENSAHHPLDGGGINNKSSALYLTNSIVAGNSGGIADSNIAGLVTSYVNSMLFGEPLLAPLGDYGGATKTMPPLPGSPAIDAGLNSATNSLTDQRALSRVVGSSVDMGAVEIQGTSDTEFIISSAWNSDLDGDGNPFGVEFALDTDWNSPDGTNSANLAALTSGGAAFGFNPAAINYTAWVLKRSLDLETDPFVEVYRYDGPTDTTTTNIPVSVSTTASGIEISDLSGAANAYYQFEAEFSP